MTEKTVTTYLEAAGYELAGVDDRDTGSGKVYVLVYEGRGHEVVVWPDGRYEVDGAWDSRNVADLETL